MSKEDLLEEIEILKGYKHMYQKLNEQNKRYREALLEIRELSHGRVDYILRDELCQIIDTALEGEK